MRAVRLSALAMLVFAGATTLVQMASAQTPSRVYVSASRSALSGGQPDWREAALALAAPLSPHWSGVVRLEESERFGAEDSYGEILLEHRQGRAGFFVAAGGSVDPSFRPEWALKLGAEAPLSSAWSASGAIEVSRFADGDIVAARLGVERSFDWRESVASAFVIATAGEDSALGFGVRLETQAASRLRAHLWYADAPETSAGVITQVNSWTVGGVFALSDTLSLRADLTEEDRGQFHRSEIALGAALSF